MSYSSWDIVSHMLYWNLEGIITVASAVNDGPSMGGVTNTAPWIVTVAASGIDRAFKSTVQLGSGKNVSGVGISCFNPKQKQYPIINAINAAKDLKSKDDAKFFNSGSLQANKVKLLLKKLEALVLIFSNIWNFDGMSSCCWLAAYVKSFHPNWTPAAIRSAIITTAKPISRRINNEAEFAYGSGQLNPTKALNPGLIYDMDEFGYIQFLCHEGYKGSSLSELVGSPINCSSLLPGLGHDAINYPTIQLSLESKKDIKIGVFRRTVTNKRSFEVVVKVKSIASMEILSGAECWAVRGGASLDWIDTLDNFTSDSNTTYSPKTTMIGAELRNEAQNLGAR
ncbi:hypothetical protein TSUD_15020 [Trifolium subterraneum]|uniref:Peptidase S8/S53 domain-containing protein n=1 Tax=Trifolium subterraneum TaxID=3900 RepID=A0A2Z6NX15_TRISU|nr:hypothetical protein TSUD_15020 [Trifolium subterraneum]